MLSFWSGRKTHSASFMAAAIVDAAGRHALFIDYSGEILQQANGLFALDYKDMMGTEKQAVFTQV